MWKDVCIYIYTYGKIYKYYMLKYLSLFIMVNGRGGLGINLAYLGLWLSHLLILLPENKEQNKGITQV